MAKLAKNEYLASKAQKLQKAKALNSEKIPVGKTLQFVSIIENADDEDGTPNASVRFTVDGVLRNISMRQYLQFVGKDGESMMNNEDEDVINIPSEITIVSATDRKNPEGENVWPLTLYKATSEMFGKGGRDFDYETLVAEGFKSGVQAKIDAGDIDAVQDYVVEF